MLVACSVIIGMAADTGAKAAAERRRLEAAPVTGMDLLNAHACGEGETKQILVRGVEDAYSPAGAEPGLIRPGRTMGSWLPRDGTAGDYDQVNTDRALADSFEIPEGVASGLFLFRARGLSGSGNDTLNFGDFGGRDLVAGSGLRGGGLVTEFPRQPGWTVRDDLYFADLADIRVVRPPPADLGGAQDERWVEVSLTDYFNDTASPTWLDVNLQDDTAMDFMGLALCIAPKVKRGVTLMPFRSPSPERRGVVELTCHNVSDASRRCDPYVGDTPCETILPVACLRPDDIPSPTSPNRGWVSSLWSGGRIAVTAAVRGDAFRTVRDVDALCTRHFGKGWRVAALHDGGRYQSVAGVGDPDSVTDRVWVDIADQPHATCWARR